MAGFGAETSQLEYLTLKNKDNKLSHLPAPIRAVDDEKSRRVLLCGVRRP